MCCLGKSSGGRPLKRQGSRRAVAAAAAAAAGLATVPGGRAASAATLYWDPGATGAGTWTTSTSTVDWATTSVGSAPTTYWANGSTAFFSNGAVTAPAYNVTLGSAIVSAGIEFNTSSAVNISAGSYAINNGTSTITVDAGAGAVDIASNLSIGTAGSNYGTGTIANDSANALQLAGITTNGNVSGVAFTGTGSITVNGVIGASGSATEFGITDSDAGTLSFTKTTTNYGSVTVLAGTINNAGVANAFGTGTLNLGNASGGSVPVTLQFQSTGGSQSNNIALGTTTGTITIAAISFGAGTVSGPITGANSLTLGAGANGATLTVSGSVNNAGMLTLAGYGSTTAATGGVTVSGVIGTNVTGVTVNSPSTETDTFTAANLYTGLTTVNSGTLVLNRGTTADSSANTVSGAIVVNAGAKLTLANSELGSGGSHTVTLNAATLNTGSGASIHNYVATLNLSGGATATLGTGGLTGIGSPAGSQLIGLTTVNSTGAGATTNLISGTTTGGIDPRGTLTFAVARGTAASDLTVSALIQDDTAGAASLAKSGTGVLTLSGANTFSQGTTVSGGTVLLAGSTATNGTAGPVGNTSGGVTLFSTAGAALLTAGAYTIANPVQFFFDPSTGVNAIGGNADAASTFSGPIALAGDGSFTQVANAGTNALNLTGGISTNNPDTYTATFAGPGTINVSGGAMTDGVGTLAVSVTGGKAIFAAASSYSGGTTITGGTVRADNPTGALGSGTTLLSGGVLAGGSTAVPGNTGGPVVVAGGTITAGTGATTADAVGNLSTGAQTWSAGALLSKVASANGTAVSAHDVLVMSGLTVTAPSFAVDVIATNGSAPTLPASGTGSVLVLADDTEPDADNPFNASGTSPLALSKLVLTVTGLKSATGSFALATQPDALGDGGYDLVLEDAVATPEPTSLLLAALAATPLTLARRRPRRASAT